MEAAMLQHSNNTWESALQAMEEHFGPAMPFTKNCDSAMAVHCQEDERKDAQASGCCFS